MNLHLLPSLVGKLRARKRVGRGVGSGRGFHTSGRGSKGTKARNTVHMYFEGGQLPLVRRLPHFSGFRLYRSGTLALRVDQAVHFAEAGALSVEIIRNNPQFSRAPYRGVKLIAGRKTLSEPFIVTGIQVTPGARQQIEDAGGSVQ